MTTRKKPAPKPAETRTAAPSLEHQDTCEGARTETYSVAGSPMVRCMECGARKRNDD